MQRKLTVEEREDLADLLTHHGVAALILDIESIVDSIEADVLKLDLSSPNSSHELFLRKARADGARRLFAALKQRISPLKSKSPKTTTDG